MKKILFISNISKKINSFSLASITTAKELNLAFYHAANWTDAGIKQIKDDEKTYGIKINHVDICRFPFSLKNIKAYKQIVDLINKEKIDYIHCNTPIGGVLGRLAGKKCRIKKVIYQAHGFHFYKGASKKNWLLYYPVEKWLAHYTDALITINQEDYELAKTKLKLRKGGKVYYVPGVGIDISQYNTEETARVAKRNELGLKDGDIALISMGDLIERKNYNTAIEAIAKTQNSNLQYFICGKGPEEEKLKQLTEMLGVSSQVHFLGFRSDIKELLAASDIFLFTTKQEGLPRSMMEAMASGLPCVASRIRGNIDLLENKDGGYLCEVTEAIDYADKLNVLANDIELRSRMGINNLLTIQNFSMEKVADDIRKLYETEFEGGGMTLNEFIDLLSEYYPTWVRKRIEMDIPLDAFVLVSVGELNRNKNNRVVISAMEKLQQKNVHYILCGIGDQEEALKAQVAAANLQENVHFLGYRTDVKEIYEASDCFVMPSYREGLSRSIMEAMASGLPCIVSNIRGNRDLIENIKGGYLVEPNDYEMFSKKIEVLLSSAIRKTEIRNYNINKIENFSLETVRNQVRAIYEEQII